MRPTADEPRLPRPSINLTRGRVALIATVVVLVVLLGSLRTLAGWYTDFLWFKQLKASSVWRSVLGSKVLLGGFFTLLFFALAWVNLWVTDRFSPRLRASTPEDLVLERVRELIAPRAGLVRSIVAGLVALVAGPVMAGQWKNWLLFRHAQTFAGQRDPQFNKNVGFYVFRLPFLSGVVAWLFAALIVVTIISVAGHYLHGGIRVQPPAARATTAVRVHLSVLFAAIALVRAVGYWLSRYELVFSSRGAVDGVSYVDRKVLVPGYTLLALISVATAIVLLVNVRLRGWSLPVITLGLWLVVSVLVIGVWPQIVQSFVGANRQQREQLSIKNNVAATRRAMALPDPKDVAVYPSKRFDAVANAVDAAEGTVRVWDPDAIRTPLGLLLPRDYYRLNDVDVDRYKIGGKVQPVMIAARELRPDFNAINSWQARHLRYTHGEGAYIARSDRADSAGLPILIDDKQVGGIKGTADPRVYFGENLDGYVVANAGKKGEVGFPRNGQDRTADPYSSGGVPVNSFIRKVAFALRFSDAQLLINGEIQNDSRVLYVRDVRERVRKLAPFLAFDSDPYAVKVNGGIVWVIDAYTKTTRYPFAQRADIESIRAESGLADSFNYARNSVKAVVNASTGQTNFYVMPDPTDPTGRPEPIIRAYREAFPKLFSNIKDMDKTYPDLSAHLRYPEDIFTVQANMFGRYRVTDADEFFLKTQFWAVSPAPGSKVSAQTDPNAVATSGSRMEPNYLWQRLPGDKNPRFVIVQHFVPFSSDGGGGAGQRKLFLTGFLTASSEMDAAYGKLRAWSTVNQPEGPLQVDGAINADKKVSSEQRDLNANGSSVSFGSLQIVPVDGALLYVRPLYVIPSSGGRQELRFVVVSDGERVALAADAAGALAALKGEVPATSSGGSAGTGTTGPKTTVITPRAADADLAKLTRAELIAAAKNAFEAAQAAQGRDLGEYQRNLEEMGRYVLELDRREAPTTTSATTPATSTTAGPTTTVK